MVLGQIVFIFIKSHDQQGWKGRREKEKSHESSLACIIRERENDRRRQPAGRFFYLAIIR
jgi:hypothetical protein